MRYFSIPVILASLFFTSAHAQMTRPFENSFQLTEEQRKQFEDALKDMDLRPNDSSQRYDMACTKSIPPNCIKIPLDPPIATVPPIITCETSNVGSGECHTFPAGGTGTAIAAPAGFMALMISFLLLRIRVRTY